MGGRKSKRRGARQRRAVLLCSALLCAGPRPPQSAAAARARAPHLAHALGVARALLEAHVVEPGVVAQGVGLHLLLVREPGEWVKWMGGWVGERVSGCEGLGKVRWGHTG